MHCRFGSMTVAAGFPRRKQPKLSMGEIPMGKYRCKKRKKKITCGQIKSVQGKTEMGRKAQHGTSVGKGSKSGYGITDYGRDLRLAIA